MQIFWGSFPKIRKLQFIIIFPKGKADKSSDFATEISGGWDGVFWEDIFWKIKWIYLLKLPCFLEIFDSRKPILFRYSQLKKSAIRK